MCTRIATAAMVLTLATVPAWAQDMNAAADPIGEPFGALAGDDGVGGTGDGEIVVEAARVSMRPGTGEVLPQVEAPPLRRFSDEEEPFEAVGRRVGTFVLRPAIEFGVAAETGDEDRAGPLVAPEIELRSDWSRHSVTAKLRGSLTAFPDDVEREAAANLRARLDVGSRSAIGAEAFYFSGEDEGSLARDEDRDVAVYGASASVTHRFERLGLKASGSVERTVYDDAEAADDTRRELRARASYRLRPAFEPFTELSVARVTFGGEGEGHVGEMRAGVIVDMGPKLKGEAAVGVERATFDDRDAVDGLSAAVAMLWSPRRLTDVRLDLFADLEPPENLAASSERVYGGRIGIERRLRSRLTAGAGLAASRRTQVEGEERETAIEADLGLAYDINRAASLIAAYEHERSYRRIGEDEVENSLSLRLRLER